MTDKHGTWPRLAMGQRFAVAAILLAASAALLLTAPTEYDFDSADSPRHALNGAFLLDAFHALPWRDPLGYAAAYYLRYPSLSIGFYPPLFYCVEAVVYAAMGVSHFAAQFTVTLFVLLLSAAAYRFARLLFPRWTALGAALLLLGAPETALWSRQVMLDIPVDATMMACVFCFAAYLRKNRQRDLWFAAMLYLAALYIKFTVCFIAVPLAAALIVDRGWRVLYRRNILSVVAVMAILSIPALWLTLRFGSLNLDNIGGRVEGDSLESLSRWSFYIVKLPEQLGWATVGLAIPGLLFIWRGLYGSVRPWLLALLTVWAGFGYVFFSAIRVHLTRHDLTILFPVVLAATATISGLFQRRSPIAASAAALLLGVATLVWSLLAHVPRVEGYEAVAREVAKVAPPNTVVLFSAFRDGNFVFAMRAKGNRPDLSILRANKWLLHFAVDRHWGISQSGYNRPELVAELHDHGVSIAVSQRGFWEDLEQMALLRDILHDPALYRSIDTLPIWGDLSPDDLGPASAPCVDRPGAGCQQNTVELLIPLAPLPAERKPIELDLPFLGRHLRETSRVDRGP